MKTVRGGSYRTLSESDIKQIHAASVKILGEVGFETTHTPLLRLLEEKEGIVDWEKKRAYFPPELISRCLEQAPSEFIFYGMEEGKEIHLGADRVYFGTGGKALYVLEENRNRRLSLLKDVARFARLADKLEYVDFFIVPVHSHDVNINSIDVNEFYQSLKNTGRPVMGGIYNIDGLKRVVELAAMLAGSMKKLQQRPFVGFISAITSPLKMEDDRAEILMEVARLGLPLVVSTAPVGGATAPITLAGILAMQNTEALLGVILSQMVNPGTPIFYSAVPCTMDMRSGSFMMGGVDSGIMNAAVAQMAAYYRIPSYLTVGVTDSKLPDAQAAYESTTNSLLGALAGGNYLHQMFGLLDGALTISYAQFVIDHDIVGNCVKVLQGVEVTPETLGIDVIAEVGPGGNFLSHQHTVERVRNSYYRPRVVSRQDFQAWRKAGAQDSWQKAEEIAAKLLAEPGIKHITDELDLKVREHFPELIDPQTD